MISKKDRDKIIILATLIAVLGFIVACVLGTRRIPLHLIAPIFFVISLILMGIVGNGYYKLYTGEEKISVKIPLVQGFFIFPKAVAAIEVITVVLLLVLTLVMLVPASFLLTVMSEHLALNFHTFVGSILFVALVLFLEVINIGFCCIYHDLQNMLCECTNAKSPATAMIHYVLLLIPVVNVVSLSQICILVTNVQELGWKAEGMQKETNNLKEVVK